MKLDSFLKIHAVIALIFGAGFIFIPGLVLSFYTAIALNESGLLMSQLFGSAILTYAAVLWLASNTAASETKQAVVKGFLYTMPIGFAVALHFQLTGPINMLGWSTVVLYAFLSVMYFKFSQTV